MINREEITDSNIIANTFCKYSTDKNIKMPQNINAKDFLTGTHNCTFQFKNNDNISILKIINELPNKSSTGFDDISMTLLKAIKTEIIPALTCIFNQSLNTGILPEKTKGSEGNTNPQERVFERYIKLPTNLTPSLNI